MKLSHMWKDHHTLMREGWWDQVVLNRCRIGHSWLTFFLGQGGTTPRMYWMSLTIKHILLDCVDFMALCQHFYTANGMQDLFTKVRQKNILAFLRATSYNFINK